MYLDNQAFTDALNRWLDAPILHRPRIAAEITEQFFYPLARNVVATFDRYPSTGQPGHLDPDDLVQECVLDCYKRIKHYRRGINPFNRFTRICRNVLAVAYSAESIPIRQINTPHHAVTFNDETLSNTPTPTPAPNRPKNRPKSPQEAFYPCK